MTDLNYDNYTEQANQMNRIDYYAYECASCSFNRGSTRGTDHGIDRESDDESRNIWSCDIPRCSNQIRPSTLVINGITNIMGLDR